MKILHILYSGLGGHGNVFFSMAGDNDENEFEYEALFYGIEDVRETYISQCAEKNIVWYAVKKTFKIDLLYYVRIWKFILKSNPDVVFLHGSSYIIPAKLASFIWGRKFKIVIRETQANHLKTKLQWIALGVGMQLADHIVCLTEEFKEQIQKKLKVFYRKEKITVISNGIDLGLYKPRLKPARKEIVVGMQSRLVKIKDHTTLLKAFALLSVDNPEIRLKIAGDGETREDLEKLASELRISEKTEFTGMISEKDLVVFLQNLDIYVHASFGETMSTSIMQAMACRLPVIASEVNGINNMIINGDTGMLIPVLDEKKLAGAIQTFLLNIPYKERLAENAYQYACINFSNRKMMNAYKKIFYSEA